MVKGRFGFRLSFAPRRYQRRTPGVEIGNEHIPSYVIDSTAAPTQRAT